MQETMFRSLEKEDSLEKEMTTHSSILAWEIPWTGGLQKPGGLSSIRGERPDTTEQLTTATVWFCFFFEDHILLKKQNTILKAESTGCPKMAEE